MVFTDTGSMSGIIAGQHLNGSCIMAWYTCAAAHATLLPLAAGLAQRLRALSASAMIGSERLVGPFSLQAAGGFTFGPACLVSSNKEVAPQADGRL